MMRAQRQNTRNTVSEVVESPEKKKMPKLSFKRRLKSRHEKEFPTKTLARHSPQKSSASFRATSRITASLGYSGSSTKFDRSLARGRGTAFVAAKPAPQRLIFRRVGQSATAAPALSRHPSWVQSFTKRFIGISFCRFSKNAKKAL